MPKIVNSIRGPIDPVKLGSTLMHEHVFVRSLETTANYSNTWGSNEERVTEAIRSLDALAESGIDTIVDLTVLGLGRDIPLIAEVAAKTSMNIIGATGAYVLDRLPYQLRFNPPSGRGNAAASLAEWFIRDIAVGMAGTEIKAGIIKCATDDAGLTPDVLTVLEASAITQRETGTSIITHTNGRCGLEQQAALEGFGADLSRVVIGHSGDTIDTQYLRRLMDAGSTIGMDRFGFETPVSTAERIRVVAELCAEGYADRMVLSHDAACHSEWIDAKSAARDHPDWNMFFISEKVLPQMRANGITEDCITAMMQINPQRLLAAVESESFGETE